MIEAATGIPGVNGPSAAGGPAGWGRLDAPVDPPATFVSAMASAVGTEAPAASSALQAVAGDRSLAERVLGAMASAEADYYRLFPGGFELGDARAASGGAAADHVRSSGGAAVSVTGAGAGGERELELLAHAVEDAHRHGMQVSLWSARVQLLTALITKGSDGLQTLFKNAGS